MNPHKKLRCGVVGVGSLGQHHARIYSTLPSVELIGIFDSSKARAKEIAELRNCRVFSSIEEMGENCDAISIVVPTDKHTQVAIPLLEMGCNLLIEKPICTTLEDAHTIVNKAKEKNLIVQVGHIEHFNPVMKFMEKSVKNPKFITADRLAPFNVRGTEVSVVLDLMIHDIGIVLQLANSEVERIDAVGVALVSKTPDLANARIKFKNGCVANLNVSRASEKKLREIRIFQPKSYMSLDFMNQTGHLLELGLLGIKRTEVPIEKDEPLKLEIESFTDCVINKLNPKVNARLGYRALEVALEIARQIELFVGNEKK